MPKKMTVIVNNPQITKENPAPPRLSPQTRQRQDRIEHVILMARIRQPMNARELSNMIEDIYPGIATGTRNSYTRAANRILKLPWTPDFPEV